MSLLLALFAIMLVGSVVVAVVAVIAGEIFHSLCAGAYNEPKPTYPGVRPLSETLGECRCRQWPCRHSP